MLDLDRTRASPRGVSRRPSSVPLLGDYEGVELRCLVSFFCSCNSSAGALRAHSTRVHTTPTRSGLEGVSVTNAGSLPLFPTPFTHPRQPQAWMHIKMDSDPLPEVDTSLFDPGFLNGFGSSSSYIEYETPSPYLINPFQMTNNLVAPLSQFIPPLHSAQDMEVYLPGYTTGELYASTLALGRVEWSMVQRTPVLLNLSGPILSSNKC
ncbi:hypothetical protein BDQ17DRAFT_773823 [Cyathus striatus]|nr:hypothetical protein BDQ17DRAFT_773823 [Cyathus striatus]